MTLDQLQQRDQRIAELEALGRRRTGEQEDLLGRLYANRDQHWRRIAAQIATATRRAAELVAYARQVGLPLPDPASD